MLTPHQRILIASAVDGSLADKEQLEFRTLLAESTEAHSLYTALLRDRTRLQALPRETAPENLFEAIMSALPAAHPETVPATPRRARRDRSSIRALVSLGLAASVFVAFTGLSYQFFLNKPAGAPDVASGHLPEPEQPPTTPGEVDPPGPIEPDLVAQVPSEVQAPSIQELPIAPAPREVAQAPDAIMPESLPGKVLTSPVGPDDSSFQSVQVRLPLLVNFQEIAQDLGKDRVASSLNREALSRIDLFTSDLPSTLEALQKSARGAQIELQVDAVAQERIKARLPPTWVVYTDALTADQAASWLSQMAQQLSHDKQGVEIAGSLHFLSVSPADLKESRELLGADHAWLKHQRAGADPSPPTTKPITLDTASEIEEKLNLGSAAATPLKSALLLTYHPREARVNALISKEIKAFHDRILEHKATGHPLMITIRQMAN